MMTEKRCPGKCKAEDVKEMIERREWKEFQEAGLLWWVNRFLHLFGWVIVTVRDSDSGELTAVFPAKCCFRGFDRADEEEGFQKLTAHIGEQIESMRADVELPDTTAQGK